MRMAWAVIMTLLAIGLLAVGGLETAKIFNNFIGVLMIPPSVLLVFCWFNIIRKRGRALLDSPDDLDRECL